LKSFAPTANKSATGELQKV